MANTFKNSFTGSVGTTGVTAYTVGSSITATTVIGLSVSNVSAANISVDVRAHDTAPTNKAIYLVKSALIPPGSNIVIVGGEQKLVLEANDTISVTSSAATSADVAISVLEIS